MVGIKQIHLSVCHEWLETVVVGFCIHHKTRKIRDTIFSHTTLRVISFSKDLMINNGFLSNSMINPDRTMTPFYGIKIFGLLL